MTELNRTSPVQHRCIERRENTIQTHRRDYRRAVRAGMVVSLVLHAVLILSVAHHLRLATPEFEPLAPVARPLEGLRVVRFRQVETKPRVTFIELPSLEEERPLVEQMEEHTRPVLVLSDEEVLGLNNPEKLKPHEANRRVWKGSSREPLPYYGGDPYVLAEEAILAGLSQMSGSSGYTENQRRRATRWFGGESDDGVGFALKGIVCGEQLITLNQETVCVDEGALGREARQAAQALAEIQQSDILTEIKAIHRERADGMRRRTREELTRQNSAGEGGP